jgi:hypothetical protein
LDKVQLSALETIMPISTTIPARPFAVTLFVSNRGLSTATKVRINLEMDRPISSIDVKSLEPNGIIKGGVGENTATVEIDRLVANANAAVTFTANEAQGESQLDKIILALSGDHAGYMYITANGVTQVAISPDTFFPRIQHIPADRPSLSITVASNEGPAVASATPSP